MKILTQNTMSKINRVRHTISIITIILSSLLLIIIINHETKNKQGVHTGGDTSHAEAR
jgi:hypothetical protein